MQANNWTLELFTDIQFMDTVNNYNTKSFIEKQQVHCSTSDTINWNLLESITPDKTNERARLE